MSKKTPVMSHDPLSALADPAGPMPDHEGLSAGTAQPGEDGEDRAPARESADAAAGSVLELPDTLTIADVGTLHKTLGPLLNDSTALVIDGGSVERVDGAGLQLLTALFKEAVARQLPVRWQAASGVLRRGAADLGVGVLLGLEDDRAA